MTRGNPFSLSFNGTNSQVNMAANSSINFTQSSKFTIEFWFKANVVGIAMTLFNKQRATTNEFVISIDIQIDGKVNFAVGKQNVAPSSVYSIEPIKINQWYHLAAVSDGINNSLFLNGTLQETSPISFTGTTQSLANGIIGHWYFNSTSYFNGYIDEFRVWNTNRTTEDINNNKNKYLNGSETNLVSLYRMDEGIGTTLKDFSNSNVSGTLVNTSWVKGEIDLVGNTNKFLILSDNEYYSLYKKVGKPLVPIMDGYENSIGSVIGSASYSTGYTWNVFDNDDTTVYTTNFIPDSSKPVYIGYRFNEPACVKRYSFLAGLRTFKFMASNNGTTWDTLDTQTALVSNTTTYQTFDIKNEKFYNYYKIEATLVTSGNAWISIPSVQFYGLNAPVLLNCTPDEKNYVEYGMDKGFVINLQEELNKREYITKDSVILGNGKVFKQKINTSKMSVKNISIT